MSNGRPQPEPPITAGQKEAWHLRKELSIGTIISLLALGGGSIFAFSELKAQVRQKAEAQQVQAIQLKQAEFKEDIKEIKEIQKEILKEQRELYKALVDSSASGN